MNIYYKGFATGIQAKAVRAFSKGNYKTAYDLWNQILMQNPNDITALKGLACCCFIDEKDRESRSYIIDALSYAANDPELHNLNALIYLQNGQVPQAIETILNALEKQKDLILTTTLNKIKNLKNPDYTQIIPVIPLICITLPYAGLIPPIVLNKLHKYLPIIAIILIAVILTVFYPNLRNGVLALNIRNRSPITPATNVSIKGINNIINARENFRIILDEDIIRQKFDQLKDAISKQQHNRAKIIVNELLASNASLAVKERVGILEGFIGEPSVDNVDFVPSYRDIAVAPSIYQGIMLRWQGTIANTHHQGRKKTTFDLLVNFLDQGQVEGIAAIELDGFQEVNNGDKITIIGPVLGITEDNRVIIKGEKILPIS